MSDKHKGLVWKIVPGIAALAFTVCGAVLLVPNINRPERYAFSGCLIEPNIVASALDFFVYWGVTAVAALCCLASFGVSAYAFTTGLMEAACAIKQFVMNYQPSRREEKPCRRRRELRVQSKVTVNTLSPVGWFARIQDRLIRAVWYYAIYGGPKILATLVTTVVAYLVVFAYTSTAICRPGHMISLAVTDLIIVVIVWFVPFALINVFFNELFGDYDQIREMLVKKASTFQAHYVIGATRRDIKLGGSFTCDPSGLDIDNGVSDYPYHHLEYRQDCVPNKCVNVRIYDGAVLFIYYYDMALNKFEVIETARFDFDYRKLSMPEIDMRAIDALCLRIGK